MSCGLKAIDHNCVDIDIERVADDADDCDDWGRFAAARLCAIVRSRVSLRARTARAKERRPMSRRVRLQFIDPNRRRDRCRRCRHHRTVAAAAASSKPIMEF